MPHSQLLVYTLYCQFSLIQYSNSPLVSLEYSLILIFKHLKDLVFMKISPQQLRKILDN